MILHFSIIATSVRIQSEENENGRENNPKCDSPYSTLTSTNENQLLLK